MMLIEVGGGYYCIWFQFLVGVFCCIGQSRQVITDPIGLDSTHFLAYIRDDISYTIKMAATLAF